jgi:hypothetical protein
VQMALAIRVPRARAYMMSSSVLDKTPDAERLGGGASAPPAALKCVRAEELPTAGSTTGAAGLGDRASRLPVDSRPGINAAHAVE